MVGNAKNKQSKRYSKIRGFTLIELIIVTVIIAVIAVVAIPGFVGMNRGHQMTTVANGFIGAINLARTEAITRGDTVRVTAVGGDWDDGYVIWIDLNGNGSLNETTTDSNEVIAKQEAMEDHVVFTANTGTTELQFSASGFANAAVTFSICSTDTSVSGRAIGVLLTGRTRLEDVPACG